jgi:hypothetical protein
MFYQLPTWGRGIKAINRIWIPRERKNSCGSASRRVKGSLPRELPSIRRYANNLRVISILICAGGNEINTCNGADQSGILQESTYWAHH